jgi:hypothetical protein
VREDEAALTARLSRPGGFRNRRDGDVDGMSVHTNSDGDEKDKVVFAKALF